MPVLHTTLRERFADRTGGYSRIHLAGSRYGDGADMAVLQLLDGPGEIKFEMLARTLGRKIYEQELCVLALGRPPARARVQTLIEAAAAPPLFLSARPSAQADAQGGRRL